MLFSKASAFALYSPLVGNDLEEIRDFLLTPPQFVCLFSFSILCFAGWFCLDFLKLLFNFFKNNSYVDLVSALPPQATRSC